MISKGCEILIENFRFKTAHLKALYESDWTGDNIKLLRKLYFHEDFNQSLFPFPRLIFESYHSLGNKIFIFLFISRLSNQCPCFSCH